ncbi:MAG TPA: hypothetical protein VM802_23700 [Chitinophaga sp.]|uniref:hypothetical protein n=1 Tax=Chitinophaga sp. TaxID=1869181 RepID=UPI002D06E073|nr:hypothetical protein [Chitinophaga sp.]HVI47893.1 hypothetical protein [Chitinophaga sp.]
MKKKTEKKLGLKMIRVAQLNTNGAQQVQGGYLSRTGPAGPPTAPPDPCQSGTCTVACPHGW